VGDQDILAQVSAANICRDRCVSDNVDIIGVGPRIAAQVAPIVDFQEVCATRHVSNREPTLPIGAAHPVIVKVYVCPRDDSPA
jgi:hypothetical protein